MVSSWNEESSTTSQSQGLPIASISGRTLEESVHKQLAAMPGYVGIASRLVQAAPDLSRVLDFLLGRVVLAGNLEQAIQMARKTGYACRMVTLER